MTTSAVVNEIEVDRPPAGTPCAFCMSEFKHFCPARVYDDAGTPVCVCCDDGEECPTRAARRRVLDGSFELIDEALMPAEVRHIDPATAEVRPVPKTEEACTELQDSAIREADQRRARNEAAALIRQVEERKKQRRRNLNVKAGVEFRARHAEVSKEVPVKENRREETGMPRVSKEENKGLSKCRHPECERVTYSKAGVCTRHFYWGTKGAGKQATGGDYAARNVTVSESITGLRAAKLHRDGILASHQTGREPAIQIEHSTAEQETETNDAIAMGVTVDPKRPLDIAFTLTEEQCDAIWVRCTAEQKAAAIGAAIQTFLTTQQG